MRILTLDVESYFRSKDYSLSKMGPIEYVRDPRFEVLCYGFRIDKGRTQVITASNRETDRKMLLSLGIEDPNTITVGHNLAGFDALVLSEYYGIKPAFMVDTIPMMHWLGLSRIIKCTHKELTATLGHGIKQAGTVVSDGKHIGDFTKDEWEFFTQYCADDVTQCSENFYSMLPFVKNGDALKLMSLTAKMGTEPAFMPDVTMLQDYLATLDEKVEQQRQELAHFLHFPTTEAMLKAIRSRIEFPKLLAQVGGAVPMKWSDKQGKEIPATSKTDLEFTKMVNDSNPNVAMLVQAKLNLNSSIQRSRAQSLINMGGGAIPIALSAYKAHTGRYTAGGEGSSDGLNFQNLSKRDPTQLTIRKALKVADGYKVVACDSSQVEARMLAWVAQQDDLVEQFREGRDPYAELAGKIYGLDAKAIHDAAKDGSDPNHDTYKTYRNVGKTAVLSAGYGVGAKKFSDTLLRSRVQLDPDLNEHEAKAARAHGIYRSSNSAIVSFWKVCGNVLAALNANDSVGEYGRFGRYGMLSYGKDFVPCTGYKSAYIGLPNGYRIWYPNLRMTDDGLVYDRFYHGKLIPNRIYSGACCENVIQSLAFHMMVWQACRMTDVGIPIKCNIHDAWIAVVPEKYAQAVKLHMEKIMGSVPIWLTGFPVGCEAEVGTDFTIA